MPNIKQYNTGVIYVTEKLKSKIKKISDYPCTLVEAPMGYGKTTAVREYLKTTDAHVLWLKLFDASISGFWAGFCRLFLELDEIGADNLEQIGFPGDSASREEVLRLLGRMKLPENTVIVLDDYHLLDRTEVNQLIEFLLWNEEMDFRLIMTARYTSLFNLQELKLKGYLYHLTKEDLEFTCQDIRSYYSLCGIRIKGKESQELFAYTQGWVSALYLVMCNYLEEGDFAVTPDITRLIEKAVYRPFSEEIKEFLFSVCLFECLGLEQAVHMWQKGNARQLLDELVEKNAFITKDKKTNRYQFHRMFQDFILGLWEEKETGYRMKYYQRAALWFQKTKDYTTAMGYFYKGKDYDRLLHALEEDRGHSFHNEYKTELIAYMKDCPQQIRSQHPIAILIFAMCLFTYNEMELFAVVCEEFATSLQGDSGLEEDIARELAGELELLLSFTVYNDIGKMKEYIKKASSYLSRPAMFMDTRGGWTFGSPSVLYMFHREVGQLDTQIQRIKEAIPDYNRLTGGHGKGADLLMEAEGYYYRGDYENAQIMIHKALYQSKSCEQVDILLCCIFLQARIALIKGDYVGATRVLGEFRKDMECHQWYNLIHTLDLCDTFLQVALRQKDGIPVWIVDGDFETSRIYYPAMAFLNIIYGRVLLVRLEYLKLLGIAEQFMEIASVYPNLLGQIYTLIYVAAANDNSFRREEALCALRQALHLALPDRLYLPFVENGDYVALLLEIVGKESDLREMVAAILKLYQPYQKSLEEIKQKCFSKIRPMLSDREMEVARMAAEGLSNCEIGQKLFVSQNTVKTQLKRVFEKLEITSRTMLKQYIQSET